MTYRELDQTWRWAGTRRPPTRTLDPKQGFVFCDALCRDAGRLGARATWAAEVCGARS